MAEIVRDIICDAEEREEAEIDSNELVVSVFVRAVVSVATTLIVEATLTESLTEALTLTL